jgi:hypothetical protein
VSSGRDDEELVGIDDTGNVDEEFDAEFTLGLAFKTVDEVADDTVEVVEDAKVEVMFLGESEVVGVVGEIVLVLVTGVDVVRETTVGPDALSEN